MTDYDIDIRSIDTEYEHTLARQVGREVDDGFEVHLQTIAVEVKVGWRSGGKSKANYYRATYKVDHNEEVVRAGYVGDAHGERESFPVSQLVAAVTHADRAVVSLLEDVDLGSYTLRRLGDQLDTTVVEQDVSVHTGLEVAADD